MNNEHKLPSEAKTTLIMELSAVIHPGLRMMAEELALIGEARGETCLN